MIKIAAAEDMHADADTDVKRKIFCNLCVLSIYSAAQAACTVGHLPHKKTRKNNLDQRTPKVSGNVKKCFDTHQKINGEKSKYGTIKRRKTLNT